jgi:uncharacterized protein YjiS (DUF1127 family)
MSCGSTTCSSTNILDAATLSFPDQRRSWKIPFAWLVGTARWWGRRSQYRELLKLDDRLLADIGMSRTVVEEMRESSLYERAWRDSK